MPLSRRPRRSPPASALLGALVWLAACGGASRALERPNRVALDPAGRLWVSDFHHQRIVVFDAEGRFVQAFGRQGLGSGDLWQVQALVPDAEGAWILQSRPRARDDAATVWEVKRFEHGRETRAVEPALPWPADAAWLNGVARMPDDSFLVVESEHGALLRYDAEWRPLGPMTLPADLNLSAVRVHGDEIWAVSQDTHRVFHLASDGSVVAAFGAEGSQPGALRYPEAVDARPGAWVAVADLGNWRVQRLDPAGVPLAVMEFPPTAADRPFQALDVVVSPTCDRLYVVDSKGGRVLVTTPDGEIVREIAAW